MKKRLLALLLAVLLIAALVLAGTSYFSFVSQTIYDESIAHLTEIFHQANQALYNMVSVNWSRMRMWAPYLEATRSDAEIVAYVDQAQAENNFTDFYFISRDSEYMTLDGSTGYLDLRKKLSQLIVNQQPVIANSVVPDQPENQEVRQLLHYFSVALRIFCKIASRTHHTAYAANVNL